MPSCTTWCATSSVSLLLVGRGEQPEAWIAELLAGRDRTVAGPTAPADGLVFLGPRYPAEFGPAGRGDAATLTAEPRACSARASSSAA